MRPESPAGSRGVAAVSRHIRAVASELCIRVASAGRDDDSVRRPRPPAVLLLSAAGRRPAAPLASRRRALPRRARVGPLRDSGPRYTPACPGECRPAAVNTAVASGVSHPGGPCSRLRTIGDPSAAASRSGTPLRRRNHGDRRPDAVTRRWSGHSRARLPHLEGRR